MTVKEETILVLYGSQRGTGEQIATDIHQQIPDKLGDNVTSKLLELDDWLLDPKPARLMIIVVSSFGMGGAPMNARKFRKLCDQWITEPPADPILEGVSFALLGLGDSSYKTYQENPKKTLEAMVLAGATLIGERGEADSSSEEQPIQIQDWIDGLWAHLKEVLKEDETLEEEVLMEMQKKILA